MKEEKDLGKRVKLVRNKLGLKQKDFAKILKMSGGALSEIESGKYKPGHDFFYMISKEFNVNLYYLIFGEGEMFTDPAKELTGLEAENEDVRQLFFYFERSKLVRYYILGYFNKIFFENKNIIDKEVEEQKKS